VQKTSFRCAQNGKRFKQKPASTMTSLDEIKSLFADKLLRTGSLDAALLKVVWFAYNRGGEEALKAITEQRIEKWKPENNG
jgi:hypothetical protein